MSKLVKRTKPTLWVIRAPESPSRPEKFIADAIADHMKGSIGNFKVVVINPNPKTTLDPNTGKDFYNTLGFKKHFTNAIEMIVSRVKNGDAIFYIEGLSPLVVYIDYWLTLQGKKVSTYGIFHCSSFTPGDMFYGDRKMRLLEQNVANSLNTIFTATYYLQNQVERNAGHVVTKVLGLPLPKSLKGSVPWSGMRANPAKHIMWSHRWAPDKNTHLFLMLSKLLPDYKFTILNPDALTTLPLTEQAAIKACPNVAWMHCKTKDIYNSRLHVSDKGFFFSGATLETFGYSLLEAVGRGWYPIVPDHASYKEMIATPCKYGFDYTQADSATYSKALVAKIAKKIKTRQEKNLGFSISGVLTKNFDKKYGNAEENMVHTILGTWDLFDPTKDIS